MTNKRAHALLFGWLILSALLFVFTMTAGRGAIQDAVIQQVRQHLLLTLNEAHFSSAGKDVNDARGLQNLGRQINTALREVIQTRWYGSQRSCVVALQRIDDVAIGGESPSADLLLSLPRNQIDRDIALTLDCRANVLLPAAASIFLGLLFLLILRFIPAPLSSQHREWLATLVEQGYAGDQAFALVSCCEQEQLELSPSQRACFDRLHDPQQRNFLAVLRQLSRPGVAALDDAQIDWFVLGLSLHAQDVDAALALAVAPDRVSIDLGAMCLRVKGLSVPTSGTPLFYYAWYARQRQDGDGWITNPASNRPDLEVGREIAELMSRHDGHGRAINDLQQTGLKARTLDQNRSKIKEDIVAVLGEKLAEKYLFETSKHPDGVHTRYRLSLESSAIEVLG